MTVFAACQTKPVSTPLPASVPPASHITVPPAPAPPPSTLAARAAEQQQMAELLRGTPVVFSLMADGSMRVKVPLTYCFDAGRAVVRPPLAAVLDRIARSQCNRPTRRSASAPADPSGRAPGLGKQRSISIRDYLTARGVGFTRFTAPADGRAGVVEIVVSDAARSSAP